MFDELNHVVGDYLSKWDALVVGRKNKEFFERLKPVAVAWKVTDLAEFDRLYSEWRTACDHIHVTWLNERWYAVLHLRDTQLSGGIELIKLMQRRSGSTGATGLDHVDFFDPEETNTKAVLSEETDLKWSEENNGDCQWVSVWFEGTEAKLRLETPVDIDIAEMQQIGNKIRGAKFARPIPDNTSPHVSEVE